MPTLWQLWFLTLAIKLVLGAWVPLFSDETYYWFWSHYMQLSYYDHPPFVAWLYWLGHPLESFGHAVRWPGIVLGHCGLLVWLKLFQPHLDLSRLRFYLFFYLLNPLIGWGSLAVLPDTPLSFFWPLAIWFLLKLMETRDWRWGFAIGAALGLGFTSKYHIVLFVPITVVWLTWTWKWKQVPLASIPAAIVTGLIGCLPVLAWNHLHNWESFRYQISHGLGVTIYNPVWAFQFLLTHLGLLFPLTVWAIIRGRPKANTDWIYYFGFGPLVFFFISSFKGRPEANWPSIAYPALLGLALVCSTSIKWAKATLAIWSILFILVCVQIAHPWIPVDSSKLKTSETSEYDVLAPYVESHSPLFASSFQMASTLSYKLKKPVFKLNGVGRRDFFEYLNESTPTVDRFYVVFRDWDHLPSWANNYSVVNETKINSTFRLLELKRN